MLPQKSSLILVMSNLNLVTSRSMLIILHRRTDAEVSTFLDNEVLLTNEGVLTTFIPSGDGFVVRLFNNPTLKTLIASPGVYFLRGYFVNVEEAVDYSQSELQNS